MCMCALAMAVTSAVVDDCTLAGTADTGTAMLSPAAGPGTSSQIILAICQPMAITSNRLSHGGTSRLIAASAALPSMFDKSDQLALLIMLCLASTRALTLLLT